ncbi:hypothetical protein HanIR_Chr13g0645411 [Helianthus annuus]|nr:hypothetical protein HanIR_Chr13g0645411 [Helianthus annuus]
MWSDFFGVCNLRLPLTVFVVEVLEWYILHISQLNPFGMIQVRNFEYTFRAFGIEPTVGDFRRFYQMTVSMGFFSFRQRDGGPKLMVPPKGLTKWKTKFFYIKAAAITARLTFRNVADPIIPENISVPKADKMDWFLRLRIIGWKKDAPLWRMFCLDFKGKVEVLAYVDGEEGLNHTIRDNFRLPERDTMEAVLPQGKGYRGALGDPDATGFPKQHMEKHGDNRLRRPKKPHEPVVVPPLVSEVAGISRIRLRKYNDYVVVSDTFEGLGVPGGGAAAGGSSAGSKPTTNKKRKGDAAAAGGQKGPKLRRTRTAAISQPKPAVTTRGKPKSLVAEKPKSPVAEKASGLTATGAGVEDQPTIQPGETKLEIYYRSCMVDRGLDYHHPPWIVIQGDNISNNPSACREILGGLGTPYETLQARNLPRGNRVNQLSSMLVGSSIIVNAIMEDYESLGRKEEETARLRG